MKIANLIRKRPREAVATAIPATSATELGSRVAAVAKIATVAVARADEGRVEGTAPPIRATRWLLHYADREPVEVWFAPAADHDEALVAYPDAVAAEPLPEVRTPIRNAVRTETAARGCSTCRHRKRPGLSAGYCGGGRDDLPGAYGLHHPLGKLPDDQGVACTSYRPHEG